jgi:hypothetical protein
MGSGLVLVGAILGMNIGILCLVACFTLLLVGYTTEQAYVGEFANYTDATCTIVDFKVVEAGGDYGFTNYLAVAGVTLVGRSTTVYAAVPQANTTLYYSAPTFFSRSGAVNASYPPHKFQRDTNYACGVPSDGLAPATFDSVTVAPFERAIALPFDREAAKSYVATAQALIIAGWVCVGVGLFCLPLHAGRSSRTDHRQAFACLRQHRLHAWRVLAQTALFHHWRSICSLWRVSLRSSGAAAAAAGAIFYVARILLRRARKHMWFKVLLNERIFFFFPFHSSRGVTCSLVGAASELDVKELVNNNQRNDEIISNQNSCQRKKKISFFYFQQEGISSSSSYVNSQSGHLVRMTFRIFAPKFF